MKKLSGSFRYTQWDPWLIISQIVSVQCIMYVSLGLILALLGTLVGDTRSLDHIFEYHEIQVRDFGGRMVITAFVINALVGSITLWYIVERTKQCMDFSCTWHFIHLIICWGYNGSFPTTFSWWALNVACATLMCVCAEFLCLRTELKAIPLSLGPKTDL
ncbi:SYS1 domain containing protein [Asbolus verrucosus]|uniref:Protein SYS1 homolog n=1 Tax=Asbolus verrucosus TaxID=1661398 RepID=A0A482VF03_ASBVE|nr:SYS1 domain containing protein [Asbolus verrucosus]